MQTQILIQSFVNGLLLGGLYAIIGLGMSLIFGIMGMTNIAHGDFMILGTFFCMILARQFTGSILLALLITLAIMAAIGFLIQNFVVNRVIDKGAEPTILVAFGLSVLIQNVLFWFFGANAQTLPTPDLARSIDTLVSTPWFNFTLSGNFVINFVVAVVVVVAVNFIIRKTSFGRAMRATADNVAAAELMGVSTKRIYTYAMCLTLVISCIAGVLIGQTYAFYTFSGTEYLIIAFGVVVIGGMGSIIGTLIGGLVLGLAMLMGSAVFGTAYQVLSGYAVMLIILTVRPRGLLGNMTRK